jgi:hypothetical protein
MNPSRRAALAALLLVFCVAALRVEARDAEGPAETWPGEDSGGSGPSPAPPFGEDRGRRGTRPRSPLHDDVAAVLGCGCMVVVAAVLVAGGLWVWMIIYVVNDAKSRGEEQAVWVIVLLFTHWLGLLIYLLARKNGPKVPCWHCGRRSLHALAQCPYCGAWREPPLGPPPGLGG